MSFTSFLHNESGAISVDYVVLTAAVVGIGIAVVSTLDGGVEKQADDFVVQTEVWRHGENARAAYDAFNDEAFNGLFELFADMTPEDRIVIDALTSTATQETVFETLSEAEQQYFTDLNAAVNAVYAEERTFRPEELEFDTEAQEALSQLGDLDALESYYGEYDPSGGLTNTF